MMVDVGASDSDFGCDFGANRACKTAGTTAVAQGSFAAWELGDDWHCLADELTTINSNLYRHLS